MPFCVLHHKWFPCFSIHIWPEHHAEPAGVATQLVQQLHIGRFAIVHPKRGGAGQAFQRKHWACRSGSRCHFSILLKSKREWRKCSCEKQHAPVCHLPIHYRVFFLFYFIYFVCLISCDQSKKHFLSFCFPPKFFFSKFLKFSIFVLSRSIHILFGHFLYNFWIIPFDHSSCSAIWTL